jgi:precorrin-6B methylase 2
VKGGRSPRRIVRFPRDARGSLPTEETRVLRLAPTFSTPPLPPDWLATEMRERFCVLRRVRIDSGAFIVEVGSGPHAIATVPLAVRVGPKGRVVAVEPSRWAHFRRVVNACEMGDRIRPVRADGRKLPFPTRRFEVAVCLHGLRSLRDRTSMASVFREMLRVAQRVFVAESLPIAKNEAQRAHLAMYELRREVFTAATGRPDDIRYPTLSEVRAAVEEAGGRILASGTLDIDLPHALAYFPRTLIEGVQDEESRRRLLTRWDQAFELQRRFGTDHPPVGLVTATRRD